MSCIVELIVSKSGKFNILKTKVLWRMILHCLMWVIWKEMNIRTFEGNERSIHELKLLFFQTLIDWANASGVFTFISLPNMLDLCTFIVSSTLLVCFFPLYFLTSLFSEVYYLSKTYINLRKQ